MRFDKMGTERRWRVSDRREELAQRPVLSSPSRSRVFYYAL